MTYSPASRFSRVGAGERWRLWLPLIAILLLATFLRVYHLDSLPPGLHYDEAFNGTMARDVLRGINRPIFFTPNFGEEPLHIYTEAVLFSVLGESPWTIRLVSAFFGTLLIPALFACVRAMFPGKGLAALAAAFIGATLYWSLNFARIGIEPIGLPFVLTLSAASLALAYRTMKWRWVITAGFLAGATVYTYLASRLWLPAIAVWVLYLLVFHRSVFRAHLSRWFVMGAVTLLTIAPLVIFFALNPVALGGRSGVVFTPESMGQNLARTAGMLFFVGDADPRDNLPGRPALDLALAVSFIIGFFHTVRNLRRPLYALLVIWLVVMALPSALTEFAPNFRRAIGAMPAVIIVCSLGLEALAARVQKHISSPDRPLAGTRPMSIIRPNAGVLLVAALLAVSTFWSVKAYFIEWASGSGLYYSFDAGILALSRELAAAPKQNVIYLSPNYREHYTAIWALDGRPFKSFDGRRGLVLPHSGERASYGIITVEDQATFERLVTIFPEASAEKDFYDAAGKLFGKILTVPEGSRPAPPVPIAANAGNLELIGFESSGSGTVHPGEWLTITLYWRALKPNPADLTAFVHLVGPTDPKTGSPIRAQADSQPLANSYPTSEWRTGELILDTIALKIPPETPPGDYELVAGLYHLDTGERIVLFGEDGKPLEDSTAKLGKLRVNDYK